MFRILVVDDEPAALKAMRRLLERAGYEVGTASDGEEALEVIFCAAEPWDLVLLDLRMPDFDGWQLMKLKAMCKRKLSRTAVVIVSGAVDERAASDLKGAAVMFDKPVDFDQLLAVIRNFHRTTDPPPSA